jgi:predicted DNA-binding transcriptional regulator YafY
MDQPKYEKMVRLMLLLAGNYCLTVKQLSRKTEISVTTIYRYIDTFRAGGMVIKEFEGVYRIDGSSPLFRDLYELIHFSLAEIHVLKHGLDSLDDTNVLKEILRAKMHAGHNLKIMADIVVIHKNAANINRLTDAMSNHCQVILKDYASANSNTVRDRLVEPFKMEVNYIQAWCYEPESGKNKLFKIARMGGVDPTQQPWQWESCHEAGFIDIFRIHDTNTIRVQLKLNTRAAQLLMEEYPLSENYLTQPDPKGCQWLLDTPVCSMEGVGRFVLGLMDEIEVIGPKEFKRFLKRHMQQSIKKCKK